MQANVDEGADRREAAMREVEDAGAAVDQHDPLAEQRVDRAEPDPEQRELDDVGHARALISPPRRGGRGRTTSVRATTAAPSLRDERVAPDGLDALDDVDLLRVRIPLLQEHPG